MAKKANADTIVLKLEQTVDRAALAAEGALARLERQIIREQNSLGRLESSLTDAKAKYEALAAGSPDKGVLAALARQQSKVDALAASFRAGKTSALELEAAQRKLGGIKAAAQFRAVDETALKKQESVIASLTDKLGSQKDKIGALGDRLQKLKKPTDDTSAAMKLLGSETGVSDSKTLQLLQRLKTIGPAAGVAVGGVLVLVAAIGAFIGAIVKGISAAAQMRGEFLKLQAASVTSAGGFSWLFNATRESARSAEMMQRSIDRVNASSAVGRDKLTEYAVQIRKARFEGKQFDTVLNGMSVAASGGTEQMAQDVLMWARQIRFMGGSVDDLSKRIEQKLGRAAAAQAISLDVQFRRLGENIRWIFGGADIDPLLRAINSVLKLFNAGSDSATGMRNAITRMVEGAIGWMLRLGIVLLKTYIAIRSHDTAWKLMGSVLKGIAIVAIVSVVAALGIILATLAAIPVAIALAGKAVEWLANVWRALKAAVIESVEGWADIGRDIVKGIAEGIASGAKWALDAITNLAHGIVNKFKSVLGIHSPSRVLTLESHVGIGGGAVRGITTSIPNVERASAQLGRASVASFRAVANDNGISWGTNTRAPRIQAQSAPIIARDPRPPTDPGSGSSGPAVQFVNCVFNGTQSEDDLREMFAKIQEEGKLGSVSGVRRAS